MDWRKTVSCMYPTPEIKQTKEQNDRFSGSLSHYQSRNDRPCDGGGAIDTWGDSQPTPNPSQEGNRR